MNPFKLIRLKYKAYRETRALRDKKQKVITGQTPAHIAVNVLLQIVLIVVFIFGVEHEVFPKVPEADCVPRISIPGVVALRRYCGISVLNTRVCTVCLRCTVVLQSVTFWLKRALLSLSFMVETIVVL